MIKSETENFTAVLENSWKLFTFIYLNSFYFENSLYGSDVPIKDLGFFKHSRIYSF